MSRHPLLNVVMALFAILTVILSYNTMDITPPSFIIAMWPAPYQLSAGQPFVVTEIFVRNRRCARFIAHGFLQNSISHPILEAPPTLLYPRNLGLMTQKFEAKVPTTLENGPAEYRMSIIWICPFRPLSWFGGVSTLLVYPVMVVEDRLQNCLPGQTTILAPGIEVELKCQTRKSSQSKFLWLAGGLH